MSLVALWGVALGWHAGREWIPHLVFRELQDFGRRSPINYLERLDGPKDRGVANGGVEGGEIA